MERRTDDLVIRPARPGDARRLADLLVAGAVPGEPPRVEDAAGIRAALDDLGSQPGAVLVAEVGGTVVGLCQLIVLRHVQHGGGLCGEVESVHVAPEHRGGGIGGALLEAAVARARAAGCYRVQLTSNRARTDAQRFYRAHGFVDSHVGFKRPLA